MRPVEPADRNTARPGQRAASNASRWLPQSRPYRPSSPAGLVKGGAEAPPGDNPAGLRDGRADAVDPAHRSGCFQLSHPRGSSLLRVISILDRTG